MAKKPRSANSPTHVIRMKFAHDDSSTKVGVAWKKHGKTGEFFTLKFNRGVNINSLDFMDDGKYSLFMFNETR